LLALLLTCGGMVAGLIEAGTAAEQGAGGASTASTSPARRWTDNTGRFSVEAELVEVREGKVQLRKADGATVALPITRLSDRDQRYLASLREPQADAKAPATRPEKADGRPPKPALPDAAKKRRTAAPRSPAVALGSPTRLAFVETPLRNVAYYLEDLHRVEIQLDHAASGMADAQITYTSRKGETLQVALDKILGPKGLDWAVLNNEVIILTTSENAESDRYREPRLYKVLRRADARALAGQITSQVAPGAWCENGGCGTIVAWPGGAVVVDHSQKIHRLLEQRFAGLLLRIDPGEAQPKQHPHKAENGPRAKLSQPIDLEVVDTPLRDVAEYLSATANLRVGLDDKALKDVGVAPDTHVGIQLRHVSLRTALALLTDQLQLAWVTTAGGVDITTPTVAKSTLTAVAYDVRDLVAAPGNFRFLVELIEDTVCEESWAANGGKGTIEAGRGGAALEVRQCAEAHEKIEQLLAALRLSARP
jgi:hypothetical protein